MIKNDDKKIWDTLFENKARVITEDVDSPGCPNLDSLIRSATEEDAEGREEISVDDEPEAFDEIDEHTPL